MVEIMQDFRLIPKPYNVNDLYPCIQGEGHYTGMPMVLLRLMGCGVGCPFCDTRETWDAAPEHKVETLTEVRAKPESWGTFTAIEIAEAIQAEYPQFNWVLLTGGEPAEQGLMHLCRELKARGYKIALETSGTAMGFVGADIDWVCVSPKFEMPGGKAVLPYALCAADEIKVVVGKQAHIDRLDQSIAEIEGMGLALKTGSEISLQPMSVNKKATELCIATVMERGWRLSLQTHKFIEQR